MVKQEFFVSYPDLFCETSHHWIKWFPFSSLTTHILFSENINYLTERQRRHTGTLLSVLSLRNKTATINTDLFSSGINLFKTFQAEQEFSGFVRACSCYAFVKNSSQIGALEGYFLWDVLQTHHMSKSQVAHEINRVNVAESSGYSPGWGKGARVLLMLSAKSPHYFLYKLEN